MVAGWSRRLIEDTRRVVLGSCSLPILRVSTVCLITTTLGADAGDAESGRARYTAHCSKCHGNLSEKRGMLHGYPDGGRGTASRPQFERYLR